MLFLIFSRIWECRSHFNVLLIVHIDLLGTEWIFFRVRYFIASLAVLAIVVQVFWMHFKSAIQLCLWGEQLSALDPVKYHLEEIPMKNWLGRLCKTRNHNYLFLYSDSDDLIPWTLVEEIADIAAGHGNYVEKKKFIGSQHVQHYRKYPKVNFRALFFWYTMTC